MLYVWTYHSLPPSIMMSPFSRRGFKLSMVASTGDPALTRNITRLHMGNTKLKPIMERVQCCPCGTVLQSKRLTTAESQSIPEMVLAASSLWFTLWVSHLGFLREPTNSFRSL